MAEAICLGPGGPTAIFKAAPAAAAQGGGGRGDAGTAAGRRRSEETVAAGPGADPCSASVTGSGARQRTDLRSSVRAEIESNMRKCLVGRIQLACDRTECRWKVRFRKRR